MNQTLLQRHRVAHARAPGCLWIALAGWSVVFVAGAGGVGLDVRSYLVPIALGPLVIGVLVFALGPWRVVSALSILGGLLYGALGVWNFIRAAGFERANSGALEVSGGFVSVMFIAIAIAASLWSLSAIAVTANPKPRVTLRDAD